MKFRKEYFSGGDKKADKDDYVVAYHGENDISIEVGYFGLDKFYEVYSGPKLKASFLKLKEAKDFCRNM